MIQLAEEIEYMDSRKVPLHPSLNRVFIEVASNNKIDIAVVNEEQLEEFNISETGDDIDIDWILETRVQDFEFEFPNKRDKYYLLFWNSNEEDDAFIAYKITAI